MTAREGMFADVHLERVSSGVPHVKATAAASAEVRVYVVSGRIEAVATDPDSIAALLNVYAAAWRERSAWMRELLTDDTTPTESESHD